MERVTDRILPYFSIGINLMLCGSFVEPGTVEKALQYGGKYASVILHFLDLPV